MPCDGMEDGSSTPVPGNYGGGTYKTGSVDDHGNERAAHEGAASDLAALEGGILLDYLRATVPDREDIRAQLREWLGTWSQRDRGWRGWYNLSWEVLDGGLVAACSDPDRAAVEGILIDLPGRACAALGNNLPVFFLWCLENGHITRADYAIDDRAGLLTRDRILECEAAGGLVTRWQNPITEVCKHKHGKLQGWTLYLGSRDGEAMVRIYDKAAQQAVTGPWVRFEFETKGELAHALAKEYFETGAEAVIGQINRRVRFAVPDAGDSNQRRWEACDWWLAFLGSVQQGPALCAGEKVETTVARMRRFVDRQAGPALAAVLEADGDWLWLVKLVESGKGRWRSKHLGALAMAKEVERDRARGMRTGGQGAVAAV